METCVQALVGKDMCDVRCGHSRDGEQPVGFDKGELVQVLPDVVVRTLADECVPVGCEIDGVVEVAVAECGTRFAHGQE